jgi:hypothetical protein
LEALREGDQTLYVSKGGRLAGVQIDQRRQRIVLTATAAMPDV